MISGEPNARSSVYATSPATAGTAGPRGHATSRSATHAEDQRERRDQQQLGEAGRAQRRGDEHHRRHPEHGERPDPQRPAQPAPVGDERRRQQDDEPGGQQRPERGQPPRHHHPQPVGEPLERRRVAPGLRRDRLPLHDVRDREAQVLQHGRGDVDPGDDAVDVGGFRREPPGGRAAEAERRDREQLRARDDGRRLRDDQQLAGAAQRDQAVDRGVARGAVGQPRHDERPARQQPLRALGDVAGRPDRDLGDRAGAVGGDDRVGAREPGNARRSPRLRAPSGPAGPDAASPARPPHERRRPASRRAAPRRSRPAGRRAAVAAWGCRRRGTRVCPGSCRAGPGCGRTCPATRC